MEMILTIVLATAVVILFILFLDLRRKQEELFKIFSKEKREGKNFQENKTKPQKFVVGQQKFSVGNEAVLRTNQEVEKSLNVSKNGEYNIGAKILPAIGIFSILIGLGFFLKDYLVLTDTIKVSLGFILGIIFILSGNKIRKKFLGYSTFLIGGGFAILYISEKFGIIFDLYTNSLGFILMIITTIAAILISEKLNSKIISGIALIGGFISPILASTGQANELILFNYILILLGGMFFLSWKKNWIELIIGSFVGTMILYGGSMTQYYVNSEFNIYWIYLLIFFVIFTIAPFLFYFFQKSNLGHSNLVFSNFFYNCSGLIIPVLTGIIFIAVSYFMFEEGNLDDVYFVIGLIPAVFYLALSKISVQKMTITNDKVSVFFFVSMTAFAIAMIPALQFSGIWITLVWFVEALVLTLIAFKTKIKLFLNIALPMLAIAIFRLFVFESDVKEIQYLKESNEYVSIFTPILNERFFIFFIGISIVFVMAHIALKEGRKRLAKVLGVIGGLAELSWIWMEINSMQDAGYLSYSAASLTLSFIYLLYAAVLMYFGVVKKWSGFRIFAIFIFGFVILKTYLFDISYLSEIWRILAFIILGFVILGVGYFYTKNKEKIKSFLIDEK